MIRKFLVCGKQLYLQSKRLESYEEQGTVIEIVMPIERFWEAEKTLKQAIYLLAAGEATPEVASVYRKVFQICAPYAVSERHRRWLHEKAGE